MEELHTEMSQTQIDRFKGQTVGDVLRAWASPRRPRGRDRGSPEGRRRRSLARSPREPTSTAFLITPLIQPGSTTDFIEHVLPILKKRGAFRSGY
jgi:alkanesulfonate monooxygenase SsuD/methylene tetrahydromethanopterin reductase-like flavin-dependent oxidoreductase (luciferase family)